MLLSYCLQLGTKSFRGKYRGHVPWLQSSAEPNRVPRTEHPAEIIPSMDKSSRWCQLSPALYSIRGRTGRWEGERKKRGASPSATSAHQHSDTVRTRHSDTRLVRAEGLKNIKQAMNRFQVSQSLRHKLNPLASPRFSESRCFIWYSSSIHTLCVRTENVLPSTPPNAADPCKEFPCDRHRQNTPFCYPGSWFMSTSLYALLGWTLEDFISEYGIHALLRMVV